ncbi:MULTISPECIES: hypothetical protein [Flavobacterium]|nr:MULTISPECIES: hypothetical protein [Flavobacterium]MCR4031840.1 hypothetical protein [Flavobacterium panacis]
MINLYKAVFTVCLFVARNQNQAGILLFINMDSGKNYFPQYTNQD